MMRSCLAVLAAVSLTSSFAAELPQSATLDDVLVFATRREQPTKGYGFDAERSHALLRLETWPEVSEADEARITAAFKKSLHATDSNIRCAGASGLGGRRHSEIIPTIIELGQKEPDLIRSFFPSYTANRTVDPPVELLRRGLHSRNSWTKRAILDAIVDCKAVALRADVEAVLKSDPEDDARDAAASTIARLRLTDSLPALRRAFASGFKHEGVAYALTQIGNDKDIATVLPLLKSENENLRRAVGSGLTTANLVNSRPACDALLEALGDPLDDLRLAAVIALGRFHDARAIPPIRKLVSQSPSPITHYQRDGYVGAVSAIGGPEAITLLEDMLQLWFRNSFGLEEALIRFGSPSSGRAIWKVYLKDPIHDAPHSDVSPLGDFEAMDVLAACADAELLQQIGERLSTTKDRYEKEALEKVIARIQIRLKK